MTITEALLAEHAVFHNLFDHTERTVPKLKAVGEVRALAHLMESLLAEHSRTEEGLLVRPLEHCLEQIGHCEIFHQEHEEIDRNLKQAQMAKNLKQARLCLLAAVASSRKHFDKEERIVFPLAEKHLKARTLTALGNTWKEKRSQAAA
jgi:hemerythrin-like domain-containing protein